jgi:hypothetical protein
MIRMLDHDGDGQVNFREFYRMATGLLLPPIGTALPSPFDDDELNGENMEMITKPYKAEDEVGLKKGFKNGKKQSLRPTSSALSSDSSSSEDTIKAKKKKMMKIFKPL